jgi:maltose-binding protein MalE
MEYVSLVERLGGATMSDDLKTVTVYNDAYPDDKAANAAAAELLYALGGETTVLKEYKEANFEGGDILFMVSGCWKQSYYKQLATNESNKQEFGWTELVTLKEGGSRAATVGVYSLVVTEKSKKKAEAVEFMKWLAQNKEVQLLYSQSQDILPSVKSYVENNEFYNTDSWAVFLNAVEAGVTRPGTPAWSTCSTYYANLLSNLLTHTMKIDNTNCADYGEMLAQVQTKLTTAVNRVN